MDIAINGDTVARSGVIIVTDLSKPSKSMDELQYWLQAAQYEISNFL